MNPLPAAVPAIADAGPGPADPAAAVAATVAFLSRPESYPERTARVERVETHMSWVFLTAAHAYKLKKPARTAFVDLRSVASRARNCRLEVRLNRRLATDVYLGVVALARDAGGRLTFAAGGEVVDWLVRMRRLPAERMLDRLIREHAVQRAHVAAVIARLTDFYRKSAPRAFAPDAFRRGLARAIAGHERELAQRAPALPPAQVAYACGEQRAFLARGAIFAARLAAGRVVEGHGDLRPEHVCVEDEPQIIDCLEFSRRLRTLDVVDELGFLALECERLGGAEVGAAILAAYREASGDAAPAALVEFYQSYRACVRATLAVRHLDDPAQADPARWIAQARRYLELACEHARRCA